MHINKNSAISTPSVLLVPYEAHHVQTYHGWMQDTAIQEATASEPLTLDEEYDNQASWRTSSDKLTFIVCEPHVPAAETVRAGQDDADARMRGDINFFLYPDDSKEGDSSVIGEVDVMVAGEVHRKQGLGSGAVRGLLGYLTRNIDEILEEYASGKMVNLTGLMVKIKEGNAGSRRLFGKLGFTQQGEVNYFGEVTLTMPWQDVEKLVREQSGEYKELPYYGQEAAVS